MGRPDVEVDLPLVLIVLAWRNIVSIGVLRLEPRVGAELNWPRATVGRELVHVSGVASGANTDSCCSRKPLFVRAKPRCSIQSSV